MHDYFICLTFIMSYSFYVKSDKNYNINFFYLLYILIVKKTI